MCIAQGGLESPLDGALEQPHESDFETLPAAAPARPGPASHLLHVASLACGASAGWAICESGLQLVSFPYSGSLHLGLSPPLLPTIMSLHLLCKRILGYPQGRAERRAILKSSFKGGRGSLRGSGRGCCWVLMTMSVHFHIDRTSLASPASLKP